jgi:hypothetical protein
MHCPTYRFGTRAWIAIMSATVLIGFAPFLSAGETAGDATLGVTLDRLAAQVKGAGEKAAGGLDVDQIQVAGKISLALQQFRKAYAGYLDRTVANLGPTEATRFNSLSAAVAEFVDHTYLNAPAFGEEVDLIVHNLPLPKGFPRLFDYSPKYLIAGPENAGAADLAATLAIRGDFYDLHRAGYEATITVAGNPIVGSATSPNVASFKIPSQPFAPNQAGPAAAYLKLDVPYRTGGLGLITHKAQAEFELPMVLLAASPGKVVITLRARRQFIEEKQVTSGPILQESSEEDIKFGGENAYLAIHRWEPDRTWSVVPGKVAYRMNASQGIEGRDWWFSRNLSTADEAVLAFSTVHHGAGQPSGKIDFVIIFTEQRPVTQDEVSSQDVAIAWGENKAVNIPKDATWTGVYTRFDGKTQKFDGPCRDAFLTVTQSGRVVNILASPE